MLEIGEHVSTIGPPRNRVGQRGVKSFQHRCFKEERPLFRSDRA